MFPTFLITLREVIEAAIILSILIALFIELDQRENIRTLWKATISAIAASFVFIFLASFIGIEIQEVYEEYEDIVEGILMLVSVFFITWVIFYLHEYFSKNQKKLTEKVKENIKKREKEGLFIMVFTLVFREGFEIALFLTTLYFYSKPEEVIAGFIYGLVAGITIAVIFYLTTRKIPAGNILKISNFFLVLFAAGLLIRAIHEFTEQKLIPDVGSISLSFIPSSDTLTGGLLKSMLGITNEINLIQITAYALYIIFIVYIIKFSKYAK